MPDTSTAQIPLQQFISNHLRRGNVKADVLALAIIENQKQETPASADDVLFMVEEQFSKLDTELSDGDLLFKIARELITLVSDELSDPFFFCEGIALKAPSRQVESLVKHRFYRKRTYLPSKETVRDVFDILESEAKFEAPNIKMFNRVARKNGEFYYDLCNGSYVRITAEKWEIIPAFPLFRRYKHQQAQVEPVSGGDPWEIFNFLAVPEDEKLQLLVFIIALFIAGIAHPILAVCGDQGSAKSFLSALINRMIDPTLTERIIQPKNERDLIQTLRQKFLTVLDNMSKIDQRVSDILCQVCTGGGISYRQLYTDEGENIAQFRHAVIINSIRLAIVNADLMDRSIIVKLARIVPEDRKPEQDLWDQFDHAQPRILGGIFDTIVKAMAIYPTVTIDRLPRLADFAKWGYAIAVALGKSGDQFLNDFANNVSRQNESVVEKNVLCQAVMGLMEGKTSHLNTVSEVHRELKRLVGDDAKDETFPKLPHHMRGQLDLLRSTLQEHGIGYQYFDRQKTGVKILFTNTNAVTETTTLASGMIPATPDTPRASSNQPKSRADVPGEAGEPENAIPTFNFEWRQ